MASYRSHGRNVSDRYSRSQRDRVAHLFIHPGPLDVPAQPAGRSLHHHAWQRWIVLGTQARLAQAMVTLNLSGYLEPYEDVSVQVADLGGTIPFLIERMDEVARLDNEPLPSSRMRRCYVDTASMGPRAIETAVACFGAERLVFGSDCPIFDAGAMRTALQQARLDDDARAAITGGNAGRLLALPR